MKSKRFCLQIAGKNLTIAPLLFHALLHPSPLTRFNFVPSSVDAFLCLLTQSHTQTVVQRGEGLMDPLPLCCSISKRFCLQWKAFDLFNKIRYVLRVMTLLETCDVTKLGRHLGFYQELEIRQKLLELVIFWAWHVKIAHK